MENLIAAIEGLSLISPACIVELETLSEASSPTIEGTLFITMIISRISNGRLYSSLSALKVMPKYSSNQLLGVFWKLRRVDTVKRLEKSSATSVSSRKHSKKPSVN